MVSGLHQCIFPQVMPAGPQPAGPQYQYPKKQFNYKKTCNFRCLVHHVHARRRASRSNQTSSPADLNGDAETMSWTSWTCRSLGPPPVSFSFTGVLLALCVASRRRRVIICGSTTRNAPVHHFVLARHRTRCDASPLCQLVCPHTPLPVSLPLSVITPCTPSFPPSFPMLQSLLNIPG